MPLTSQNPQQDHSQSRKLHLHRYSSAIGILSALGSGILISLMLMFVHDTKADFSAAEVLAHRSLLMTACLLPFCTSHFAMIFKKENYLLWLRGVFACFAMYFYFYSTQRAEISIVSIIVSATPLLVYSLSAVILKEEFKKRHAVGCLTAIVGLIIMSYGPGVKGISNSIVLLLLVTLIFRGASFVTLRAGSNKLPTQYIMLVLVICTGVFGFIMGASPRKLYDNAWHPNLLGVSVTALFMQYFLTVSYRKLQAGSANLLSQTSVIFSLLLGYFAHGYLPTYTEWIASGLVLVGALYAQDIVALFRSLKSSR